MSRLLLSITKYICVGLFAVGIMGSQTGANGWVLPNGTNAQDLVSDAPKVEASQTGWILKTVAKPKPTVEKVYDAAGNERIVLSKRPVDELFNAGSVVVTGFSGVRTLTPRLDPDLTAEERAAILASDDLKFIDLDGQSASLTQINNIGYGFNGNQVTQKPYDKLTARDVGQVFGIAIDDERYPNLYVTATSVFGLQIVGDDTNEDRVVDRLKNGARDAQWMNGQWGSFKNSGPGSVYKVDGYTGQISLFATIKIDDRENSGAGLGNIAFDRTHNQFFVSDLETGLIHRLDNKGVEQQVFDHGIDGRSAAKRSRVRFNPRSGIDIARKQFDALDPETWNYAKKERRVWGMAVRGSRLFYAVADGPEVWSIGIDKDTSELLNDPRWELTVADAHKGFDVSDIVFTPGGAMILAQRPAITSSYDYKTFTHEKQGKVLRYVYESPEDDPDTPSVWYEQPEVLPVGFQAEHNSGLGGVDLGPSYDDKGRIDWRHCNGSLLSTGQALRDNASLSESLIKGGELRVDGIQIAPRAIKVADNSPPWLSYQQDYDGVPQGEDVAGHIGDVEVLDCGRGRGGAGGNVGGTDGVGGDVADLPDVPEVNPPEFWCTKNMINAGLCICAIFPHKCFPKKPKKCVKVEADVVCNKTTGTYELTGNIVDQKGTNFDGVKIDDPSGNVTSLPTTATFPGSMSVDLSGMAPGQAGQLDLCAYNAAERDSNEPYNCCNQTVNFKIPGEACVAGAVE